MERLTAISRMAEFRFHPVVSADIPMLCEWLNRPHVAEVWDGEMTLASTRALYDPLVATDRSVTACIAWRAGEPIGFIQSYVAAESGDGWWPDISDSGVLGIDQFLADEASLGRGVGTRMIREFLAQLFTNPAVTRVQVDPSPGNARAIACYEKCGFQRTGIVETPDGPALLMVCGRDAWRTATEALPARKR